MACCVPEIGADARVDDGDVEEKSLILESRVVVERSAPASVVMSIRRGFSLLFTPLALSRKGHVSSTTN